MAEMVIEKDMVIDKVEYVKSGLESFIGKKIKDMEIIRKFICTEKYTKFFIDKKMKSSVNRDTDNIYVWLDTGLRDSNNNALFISLRNNGENYRGHYVGTAHSLTKNIREHYPKNKKDINTNYSRFISKYNQKCLERENPYIEDEKQYLLCKVNESDGYENEIAEKIRQLNVSWEADPEEIVEEEATVVEETDEMSAMEEDITIGLLLDMLKEREQYIEELLKSIEKNKLEKDAEIQHLVEVIKKQSSEITDRTAALNRIRNFTEEEAMAQSWRDMTKEEKQVGKMGHKLLEKRKKIVLLGTSNLSIEVMKGIITKEYGFEEADFVYETDYNKVVHTSGRILDSNRYQAIIFGCCPHSAMRKGRWSSLIESCRQSDTSTFVVDARTNSGKLKVTKASFREALEKICEKFSDME